MVTSQPYRSGSAQAWWALTGSTNRGFVSLDPERQREVDTGRAPAKKHPGNEFRFDVHLGGVQGRPMVPGRAAPKAPGPGPAGGEPAGPEVRGRRR